MKNKKVVWIVSIIIILGGTFYIYNQKQDNGPKIEEQLKGIDKESVAFEKEKNESKQFKELEKLIKESDEYKKGTEKNKKVIKRYDDSIYQARKLLKDKNETTYEESKITNLSKASTRNITMKVNSLKVLSKRLEIQDVTVYDKKELNNFKSKVTTLRKSYDKQLNKSDSESDQKSESASTKVNEQPDQTMDFSKIKQGDYTSLLGNWKEVATSANRHDGAGDKWSVGGTHQLTISKNQISDGFMKFSGEHITANDQTGSVAFKEEGGVLTTNSSVGATAYNLSFYPRGIEMTESDWGPDVPTVIDNSKDRFIIRSSGSNYVQVFERINSSSIDEQNTSGRSNDISEMNTKQIQEGDYSSIKGEWKNGRGKKISVTTDIMKFTDITGVNQGGSVEGLKIDIPEMNLPDGTPKLTTYGFSDVKVKSYDQQLKVSESKEGLSMASRIPGAVEYVSFLPKGTMGDLQEGNRNQDKIIAVMTQNNATSVQKSEVYYRVD
ncbi:DUF6287 domain-containing protein [Dellaglioa algida]|uniref:DUF6287 domain-containing protein n=1 Tax=Dellaglioa algida TaxID=105612 RepID=UPI000BCC4345|nr:DUF6287 domain-containing protein [Dellaglioa algida]MDK1718326.1 DUF6287 domain-containing protein [Dellaglioa algida]MDK1728111.1 DUF6287 domain-containing protein [Dellaglioa algida]MDK1729582.1 DUF6287 domain-containing protein [Dellaglioa algida]MDK1735763.1 DUF6287 domain-containing protein [Dellaglioa algida]MDK1737442.1 DUF6287 domain-containing protein [Dellaglioa algida]